MLMRRGEGGALSVMLINLLGGGGFPVIQLWLLRTHHLVRSERGMGGWGWGGGSAK